MGKGVNLDYLLWKKIKAGNTQAFHELYVRYADILFSFGMIFSKDQELVRDCIHDLFFDLFKYRKNLSDNDNIRSYLFKALKRKIQPSPGKRKTVNLVYSGDLRHEADHIPNLVETDETDEDQLTLSRITKLIQQLPAKQQEVLNLRFQLDLTYPEIAAILEISTESVRTSVYRSIKTIRQELEGENVSLFFIFQGYHHLISHKTRPNENERPKNKS
jgi:RNA polymerase sigma factor (sigma-70 family)